MPAALRVLAWLLLALAALVVAVWAWSQPARPDAFYAADGLAAGAPGTPIRFEPFQRGVPAGARGWRLLYWSADADGRPVAASALLLVPDDGRDTARPLLAWTHGTTGVATGCAPSLLDEPFAHLPALPQALAAGWAVVAPDYPGLGTAGVHGYLVGDGTARASLDAIRAARALAGIADLTGPVLVWGHSQGGHTALWTAGLAPSHAPELPLAGVAALAPASDLVALVRQAQATLAGRILSAYLVTAYLDAYPELDRAAVVRPGARWLLRDMARRCLAGRAALVSVLQAQLAGGSLFADDPGAGAFGALLAGNVPVARIAVPVLIAQGEADDLVLPAVQRDYARARCADGQPLAWAAYAGRDHLSLVAPGSPLEGDLMAWSRDRLAGAPTPDDCPDLLAGTGTSTPD